MGANVWPVNAVSGAPQYSGRMLRQTTVAPFTAMGSAARPLGAKSGIRLGTPPSIVAVTSTTWTVQPFAGILDGETAAVAGPYGYAFDTAQTGSMTAAGSSARKDRLDVQVSDPAEDGTSTPSIQIVYTQGAATGNTVPAAPARSHALCVINVPAAGGGSPSVSWAPEWCGDPGEWTFNTVAERDAYVTAIGSANVPVSQRATVLADSTPANNGDYAWSGSLWLPVSGACVPHALYLKTLPSAWPASLTIHTWDATPVEGAVNGFTVSGGVQRFTITTPGVWRFAGALGIPQVSGYANIEIRKNGVADRRFNSASTTTAVASAQFNYEKQLAVGDYIEFYTLGSGSGGPYNDAGVQLAFLNVDYVHV